MKTFWRQSGPSFTHKVTREFIEEPKVLMHYCEHEGCEAWGSHSIGAAWIRNQPGRWYCAAHIGLYASSTSSPHDAPVSQAEAKDDNDRDAARDLLDGA